MQSSRRVFLQQIGAMTTALAPVVVAIGGCATGLASYRVSAREGILALNIRDYAELAHVGGGIELEVPGHGEPLIVVRTGEDSFAVLSPVCTHLGCTVRREPSFFRCPCHGSTYTLEGTVVRGPATNSLDRYPVQQVNDLLTIQLG